MQATVFKSVQTKTNDDVTLASDTYVASRWVCIYN